MKKIMNQFSQFKEDCKNNRFKSADDCEFDDIFKWEYGKNRCYIEDKGKACVCQD